LKGVQARTHGALLDLYALDTRLRAAQARLTSLHAQAARLTRERALLEQQLSATQRTLTVSQHQLGTNLRLLYKQGDVSALAVVLGASSLDEAVSKLDALSSFADESQKVVEATSAAQLQLAQLRRSLADRRALIDTAIQEAERTATALTAARTDRLSFISQLRAKERLKTAQINTLQAAAQRAERKSNAIQATAAPDLTQVAPTQAAPTQAGETLTVSSTGYSLPGRTSTGIPVGWGVIAVDPSVIPLGTRVTVPGYGEAVAADTGSAVRGATIDLWFPSLAQARAWGRRTVTITLH
jgi:3D (Asp-Asp-Asp) domain-containing protein